MYPLIYQKVFCEPWFITDGAHHAIRAALISRLMGDPAPEVAAALIDSANFVTGNQNTSVIPVFGIMGKHLSSLEAMCGGCSMEEVSANLEDAATDSTVDNIVLHINSPGGTAMGTPELAEQFRDITDNSGKTTFAYTDGLMCSAAYYLASQAHQVFASPSSVVGSVGTILRHQDISEQLAQQGVKITEIYAGPRKARPSPFEPLSDEMRAELQTAIDELTGQFKAAVTARRDIAEEHLEGQTLSGDHALAANFIDGCYNTVDHLFKALT